MHVRTMRATHTWYSMSEIMTQIRESFSQPYRVVGGSRCLKGNCRAANGSEFFFTVTALTLRARTWQRSLPGVYLAMTLW